MLLRLMLRNLLENASRYSPEQSSIVVQLSYAQGGSRLSVIDEGRASRRRSAKRLPSLSGGSISAMAVVVWG